MSTLPNIERLFLEYIEDMGESPGGFISILKPEHLENGDPKTLGKQIQSAADYLDYFINHMDFEPWELEKGKIGSRLKNAVQIYRQMGVEIEMKTEQEPKDYHLYVIALLMDIISSLLNHVEMQSKSND
ncbi:hypothetical protein [Methanobacterium sp. ACI-7]|uniref:hypothetical protein n=1 Tax=unclassified Methanobacterium TaxID=2627676 RepID=UPI0039C44A9D